MFPARLLHARHAVMIALALLGFGALPCPPSLCSAGMLDKLAPKLGEVRARARKAQEEIARKRREADAAMNQAQRTLFRPIDTVRTAADSLIALKNNLEGAAEDFTSQGGDPVRVLPDGLGTGNPGSDSDAADKLPGDAASHANSAFDLSEIDGQWRQAVSQEVGDDLCARLARRPRERNDGYASRIRAALTVARGDVAALISGDPALEITVRGGAIQWGAFSPTAAGAGTGWLNFSVAIENRSESPSLHLLDPANGRSLASYVAAGPAEGDEAVTLKGVLTCTASVARRLRGGAVVEAHVVFNRSQFDISGDPAASACTRIASVALAPVDLRLIESGHALEGVRTSFGRGR